MEDASWYFFISRRRVLHSRRPSENSGRFTAESADPVPSGGWRLRRMCQAFATACHCPQPSSAQPSAAHQPSPGSVALAVALPKLCQRLFLRAKALAKHSSSQPTQPSPAQFSPAQRSPAQPSPAQPSRAQPSPAQPSSAWWPWPWPCQNSAKGFSYGIQRRHRFFACLGPPCRCVWLFWRVGSGASKPSFDPVALVWALPKLCQKLCLTGFKPTCLKRTPFHSLLSKKKGMRVSLRFPVLKVRSGGSLWCFPGLFFGPVV